MRIIIKDFMFKGKHYDEATFEMPNVSNIEDIPEDIPEDKIVPYVIESLNELLKEA